MKPLEKQAASFVLRALGADTAPDQVPGGRHHIKTHEQALLGCFAHHGGEDHGVDLRRGVFHGKTRVSISVRFNAAEHGLRWSVSHPVAIRLSNGEFTLIVGQAPFEKGNRRFRW